MRPSRTSRSCSMPRRGRSGRLFLSTRSKPSSPRAGMMVRASCSGWCRRFCRGWKGSIRRGIGRCCSWGRRMFPGNSTRRCCGRGGLTTRSISRCPICRRDENCWTSIYRIAPWLRKSTSIRWRIGWTVSPARISNISAIAARRSPFCNRWQPGRMGKSPRAF